MTRPTTTKQAVMPAKALEAIWGTVLPIPAGPDAGDDFEARVERAWSYLKTAHFAAAEHDRLREELGKLIAKEGTSEY